MEKPEPQNIDLIGLYRIAEENHRFYVDKRFTIISLYFPLLTVIMSSLYVIVDGERLIIAVIAFVLTLFLYSLENRNWILSNTCLDRSTDIGKQLEGEENMHFKLKGSYNSALPAGSTILDRIVRKIAPSQHKAVSRLTMCLLLIWLALASCSLYVIIVDL